ncbi:MAG: hypothetical protein RMK57_03135 [Bryobacterales bacterium]|nr:hypothetical protein [Bryobacteraceae bacterium]MDW8353502.1 hypothetical protein [Bryobacterales bacterium]
MCRRVGLFACLVLCASWAAQKYDGPRPPKADVPYLQHADNLIETESGEAREENRRDEIVYIVTGASSPARTPMAEPIFLFLSESIPAEKLALFAMQVRRGNREIAFPQRRKDRGPRPLRLSVRRLEDKLYRIEANQTLENGQYCLSPEGSNKVFCFEVY